MLSLASLLANDPVADDLRGSARAWEARDRTDLARQALTKLASMRSVRADDLLLLAELDLDQSDLAAARSLLDRLNKDFPESSESHTLATELRVTTNDRLGLASIHRQAQIGQTQEIRSALRRVYPDGAPNGILGIDYYELLAAAPNGMADAVAGLADLSRRHPADTRYTLALARLLSRRAATARAAVTLLEPLRGRADVRRADYNDVLDRAQATLAAAPADTVEVPLSAILPVKSPTSTPTLRTVLTSTHSPEETAAPHDDRDAISAAADATAQEPAATPDARPDGVSAAAPGPSVWDLYRAGHAAVLAGDRSTTASVAAQIEARTSSDPDAVFARALLAESLGDRQVARDWVDRIPLDARSEGVQSLVARLAVNPPNADVALPTDTWSGGLSWTHKPGDAGLSALTTVSVPVEWRHVLPNQSSVGFMVQAVSLDAGNVPADALSATGLGSVAVGGLGAFADASTHTTGLALGMAWHQRDWVVDLGTTPLGFALHRWIGGIRYAPTIGTLDTVIEGFRRPLTSSLLSFAGRTDPATGRVWGGVTDSGVAARVGHYTRDASLSLSIRATVLEGTHVETNHEMTVRLSGDHTVARPFGGALSLGVTASLQAYDHNVLGYTYGSGGYFSPQSYTTAALPLEWLRRTSDTSVRLSVAPTYTHRHDAASPWYPLDSAMTLSAQAAGIAPSTPGGSADGLSGALSMSVEWRVSGGVVGIGFEHDRADYYRPISLSVYYRPGAAPGTAFAPYQPYLSY
jgi:Cellulose synthase operon protein C C-terminus (BCSC_C)